MASTTRESTTTHSRASRAKTWSGLGLGLGLGVELGVELGLGLGLGAGLGVGLRVEREDLMPLRGLHAREELVQGLLTLGHTVESDLVGLLIGCGRRMVSTQSAAWEACSSSPPCVHLHCACARACACACACASCIVHVHVHVRACLRTQPW